MENANSAEFSASETGEYQLVTSLVGACSKTSRSSIVAINVSQPYFELKPDGKPLICSIAGSLTLYATKNAAYSFDWFKGDVKIPGNADSLVVTQPGNYWAIAHDPAKGCKSFSDTIKVEIVPPIAVTLFPSNSPNSICKGDSLLLYVSEGSLYRYQWYSNGKALPKNAKSIYVASEGLYEVEIADSSGCVNKANAVEIKVQDEEPLTIEPLDPVCENTVALVPLIATPIGGIFSGTGVETESFDPKRAGPGVHEITYTLDATSACPGVAKTNITVYARPIANAGRDVFVLEGESASIGAPPLDNTVYLWQPPSGLDDPAKSEPLVTPTRNTVYTLKVTDVNGCSNEDAISVNIFRQVLIPDASTPNGDGLNETWELRGITSYPNAEVTIFNRWGTVVFHSKGYEAPFDGKYKEQLLAAGAYPYVIYLEPSKSPLKGNLMLVR